ncbi:hypothetical protein BD309DRAFT_851840 [Dichomitus squalens]|nr:hypothetical protein BD309DRAFT_851840 [Dichomitus squalens]
MDSGSAGELELRAHVHSLMTEYALQHLTTNYVTWTQDSVANLLSESLAYAPTRSPTDVFLTKDPFEYLCQKWGLSKLDVYEERWVVEDVKTLSYLKREMDVLRSGGATERVWKDGSDGMCLIHRSSLCAELRRRRPQHILAEQAHVPHIVTPLQR